MQLPQTEEKWKKIATEFYNKWQFPNCVGAIDTKHSKIQKPKHSGSLYLNYKKEFSIVLLAVVNAYHEFIMPNVEINGRISDGGVLRYSTFGQVLYNGKLNLLPPVRFPRSEKKAPYVRVADDAFALHPNMIKPYPYTSMEGTQIIYSWRVSNARNIVEDTFYILNSRFEIFHSAIALNHQRQLHLYTKPAAIYIISCVDINHTTNVIHQ